MSAPGPWWGTIGMYVSRTEEMTATTEGWAVALKSDKPDTLLWASWWHDDWVDSRWDAQAPLSGYRVAVFKSRAIARRFVRESKLRGRLRVVPVTVTVEPR